MTNNLARKSELDVLEEIRDATLAGGGTGGAGGLTDAQLRADAVPVTAGHGTTMTATISFGQFFSEPLDLGVMRLGRIDMPDSWDAANLGLRTSSDGSTWKTLYNADGTEYTIIVPQQDVSVLVNLADMLSLRYVQLCSGTPTDPVTQTDDRVITLALVP